MFGVPSTVRLHALRAGVVALLVAAAVLPAPTASADSSDPERVEERLPTTPQPSPESAGPAGVAPLSAEQADMATFPPFTLRWVALEGMIAPGLADACTEKLVGKTVGAHGLGELTRCITQVYRDRGFFLSRAIIPPQEVQGGALKIKVFEGYIAAVAPTGMSEADANAQFAATLKERPAKLDTFERALLLLADRYGYRITSSQLVPDPQDPARYTFKLAATLSQFSLRFFSDNRGTDAHGPDQAYGWAAWNAVFGDDRLAASLFTTPSSIDELVYGEINYASSWLAGDLWTELGASFSQTEDGELPSAVAVSGEAKRFYLRASVPILRARSQSLWINMLFDARETAEDDPVGPDTDEHTRVLRAGLTYTVLDGGGRNDITLEVSQGLDVFGASSNGDAFLTRPDGRPQFTKLRLEASRLQKLGPGLDVLFSAAGQLADGALVSAEEFGAGGARFGRAYDYSEITGDEGAAGAVELRYTFQNVFDTLPSLQLYAFADAATVRNEGTDPSALRSASLSSSGLGIRLAPVVGVSASVEVAKPLSREVAEESDKNARVFLSLLAGW